MNRSAVWIAGLLSICAALPALAQNSGLQSGIGEIHIDQTGAANTAVTVVFDSRDLHSTLAIDGTCSSGNATLTVKGDQVSAADTSSAVTIDTISAASPQIKQYTPTTVGASVALSPLAFRWVTVSLAACGSGQTGTLIVGEK